MMEREGVVCLRRAWHFGKAQEKGRALGIRMDSLFIYHALIKSLSFVVHKSLILRSKTTVKLEVQHHRRFPVHGA